MKSFIYLCIGQLVSVLTTRMRSFAIGLWIYGKTGSALNMGLTMFFLMIPNVIISPIAGVICDRYDRKKIIILSDSLAGLVTLTYLILFMAGNLELWHIYVGLVITGIGDAFQRPALIAVIPTIVDYKNLSRANGMRSLISSGGLVLSPIFAAAVYPIITLKGIFLIDIGALICYLFILACIKIPRVQVELKNAKETSFFKDLFFGFNYLYKKVHLFNLMVFIGLLNFFGGIVTVLISPMILAKTGNNSILLGTIMSTGGIAGIGGGFIMSVWGGFKKKVQGALLCIGVFSFCGIIPFGMGKTMIIWMFAIIVVSLMSPILNTSLQTYFMENIENSIRGRVFSIKGLIGSASVPLAALIGGYIADTLFEPFMLSFSSLAQRLTPIFGNGPGSGIGLLITLCGLFLTMITVISFLIPSLKKADTIALQVAPSYTE